ncbi:hypothetical protein QR680_016598 [Steinernema hermaphroditum]|uniref:PDZ domain-containing protein n=1 Tax=Steinernema hermaphroditum TaxID=289476 RepID=A0AA39LMU1_9BILA|nr:hypothetical protein QR680_016598 [Steinernema hermaphroditum]
MAASKPCTSPTPAPPGDMVESVLSLEMKAPFTIGLMLSTDNPPKITKLLPSSSFLGKLFAGDIILCVNEQKIANIGDFFKYCKPGKVSVRFKRDEYCTTNIKTLPKPKPDIESFEFQMMWRTGGMPIGILVYQDAEKRVIVSMVENGTVASQSVRAGDILTKVNDVPVKDKEIAKKLILDSVNTQRRVKMTIERSVCSTPSSILDPKSEVRGELKSELKLEPKSEMKPEPKSEVKSEVKAEIKVVPQVPKLPNFDLPLPADVLAIMDTNVDFHRKPYTMPAIIKRNVPGSQVASGSGTKLSISNSPSEENALEYDPSEKPLKVTPKRVGSA